MECQGRRAVQWALGKLLFLNGQKICALSSICDVCSSHLPFFWGIGGHNKIILCGFPRITIVIKKLF